ncbi:DUF2141 domain-containing protein [Algoriphagus limi]|uniref:DUF2141 domain-containing protein n=1 Tax=Algoriphagus limi TaxID=2975273 RepID=A0ABT2G3W0_9BACT|nr:DUF2141 domain-containing protein [Algoriphagus limi]MCS5489956.1 DUF2141 domain-containing protein [Algoriphagus limi]
MYLWIINLSFFLMGILPQSTTQLELHVTNSDSDQGLIRILVFDHPEGFPDNPKKAKLALSLPIENLKTETLISSLPPGKYAICAFHDEDENGKINKNLVGYPTESFGFSTNPKVVFSIPSFEKCLIEVEEGIKNKVTIELKK